jgi:hypothetical protein
MLAGLTCRICSSQECCTRYVEACVYGQVILLHSIRRFAASERTSSKSLLDRLNIPIYFLLPLGHVLRPSFRKNAYASHYYPLLPIV